VPHGTKAAGPRAVAPYVPRAAAARTDGGGLPRFIERELGFLSYFTSG
jgi:hypothetical protein